MAEDTKGILRRPALYLAAFILAWLVVALWAARAPTSFTGKMPGLDALPIELNAVYVIVLGPLVTCLLVAGLWILIADRRRAGADPALLNDRRTERVILGLAFFLILLLSTALSAQYFLILAPSALCGTRPHFDFLWTNVPGPVQISHCMSGTADLNAKAPYYLEPQIVQSWGYVLCPLIVLVCLVGAWRSWSRADGRGGHARG